MAVYSSDYTQAGTLIPLIRTDNGPEMADFLKQVLIYTRAYEKGATNEQAAALALIDAQISRLETRLESQQEMQFRLDAGNIMMNAARIHLLSRNIMRSAQLAKAAYRLLDEILKNDPQQSDAFLSMGLYQYFAANENNAWGWIKRLLALEGDKEKGRALIERAVMESPDFGFEAARSLMMDLNWDYPSVCRYADVYDSLEFPPLKSIEHRQRDIAARLFCRQAELGEERIIEINKLLQDDEISVNSSQKQWLFEAKLHALAMQGQRARLSQMLADEALPESDQALLIRFSLARVLDVAGRRSEAKQLYSQVEKSTPVERYRTLAAAYQRLAYRLPERHLASSVEALRFACAE